MAFISSPLPKTLSSIFSKMNDLELIEVKERNIKILDSDGMKDLTEHVKI